MNPLEGASNKALFNEPFKTEPRWVTIAQAARMMGVTVSAIYWRIRTKQISHRKRDLAPREVLINAPKDQSEQCPIDAVGRPVVKVDIVNELRREAFAFMASEKYKEACQAFAAFANVIDLGE